MRRIVLFSVLLSFAARRDRLRPRRRRRMPRRRGSIISLPGSVTRGRLTSARISMPGTVAAVDGRILVSSKAAEVIGVAVPRKAVSMMPVAIKGGYAFGAYNLKASHGRTIVDVVLLPRKSGKIGIKVTIDAMADAKGRRISKSGASGLSASRTLGAREASRKAGTRRGSKVYSTGTAERPVPDPRRERAGRPQARSAGACAASYGTKKISKRDQDYARQAWTLARSRNQVCDAKSAARPER